MYTAGIPAKSGVGGGVMGRIARCHGVSAFAPPLDEVELRKGPIGNQVHHEQARPGCIQR